MARLWLAAREIRAGSTPNTNILNLHRATTIYYNNFRIVYKNEIAYFGKSVESM